MLWRASGYITCEDKTIAEFQNLTNTTFIKYSGTTAASDVVLNSIKPEEFKDSSKYEDLGDGRYRHINSQQIYKTNSDGTITNETTNRNYSASGALIQEQQTIDKKNDGLASDITEFLLDFVVGILAVVVWAIGILVQIVFWLIANIFLYVVRINPASSAFLQVATAPWNIVVNLANIVILGSFIFVGLGYIVGLDAVKKKKSTASDFLINIVIIAVTINFTLSGAATVINVVQGVGDLMYVSYVRRFGGDAGSDTVINNLVGNLKGASEIQCGAQPGGNTCEGGDNLAQEYIGAILGEGSAVPIFVRQCVYILLMLYAVFIFIKALRLALFRAVGLWLLMITSPLALVMYLSPVDGLKKQAYKWFSLFWQMTIFYPAFLFALIVINSLSGAFSSAANNIANEQITTNTLSGGINASAALVDPQDIVNLVLTVLGAVVAVFALQLITDFFEKGFGEIASAALNGVTSALGQATRLGGAAIAAGVGVRNNSLNKKDRQSLKSYKDKNLAKIEQQRQLLNKPGVSEAEKKKRLKTIDTLRAANRFKDQEFAKTVDNRKKGQEKLKSNFNTAGDLIESTDDILKGAGNIPKNYMENLALSKQGRQARLKEQFMGRTEGFLRGNAAANAAMNAAGYNIDGNPNLRRFEGLGPDEMNKLKNDYYYRTSDKDGNNGRDFIADEVDSRAQSIFNKTLGKTGKYDSDVASTLLDSLSKEIGQVGGVENLSEDKKAKYRSLLKQSITDDNLRGKILSDRNLVNFAQDQYSLLNDPKVEQVVANRAPVLHGDARQRELSAAEAARNKKYRDRIDANNFDNDEFAQAALKNGMSIKDLRDKTPYAKGLTQTESLSIQNERKKDAEGNASPTYLGTDKATTQSIDTVTSGLVAKGAPFEDELIDEVARIDANEDLNAEEKEQAKNDTLKRLEKRYFGVNDVHSQAELESQLTNMEQVDNYAKQTTLGKAIAKTEEYKNATPGQKIKIMRNAAENVRQNWKRNVYSDGGKTFTSANGNYKTQLQNASKKHNNLVETKKGQTELANNVKQLSRELMENNADDAHEQLNKDEIKRVFGAEKVGADLTDSIEKRARVEVGNKAYELNTLDDDDREEFTGLVNRYMAANTGQDNEARTKYRKELKEKFGDDPKAREFLNEQVFRQNSELNNQVLEKGGKITETLQSQMQNGKKGPNASNNRKVLQRKIDDVSRSNKQKIERLNDKAKNIGAGDFQRVVYGTDENNIDTSRLVGGPNGSGGGGGGTGGSGGGTGGSGGGTGGSGGGTGGSGGGTGGSGGGTGGSGGGTGGSGGGTGGSGGGTGGSGGGTGGSGGGTGGSGGGTGGRRRNWWLRRRNWWLRRRNWWLRRRNWWLRRRNWWLRRRNWWLRRRNWWLRRRNWWLRRRV